MGTNLSQVFIQNGAVLEDNSTNPVFSDPDSGQIGIWDSVDSGWIATKLFQKTFSPLDTDDDDGAATATSTAVAFANPNWLYSQLQFVQGTAGNPIATPLLDVRNIRSLSFDHYLATAGHKTVLTPNPTTFTGATIGNVTIRVIARTTPTDQLSYYDQEGTNYSILSGNDPFPLGAFNTTNHKVISVEVNGSDFTTNATFIDAAKIAIEAHGVLSKLVTVTDGASTMTIQSKHVGFIFDVAIIKSEDNSDLIAGAAAANLLTETVTGQDLGVGNPWQVLGEEIRCRSRYGNFNRMYLPQNMPTYTVSGNKYHKVTVEYEHNWPNSTGIAPAGALNQVVLYIGAATAIADNTTDENIAPVFGLTSTTGEVLDPVKYVW